MKKNITILILCVVIINFISCDTLTRKTIRISVDRHPTLIIENQTGHPVTVTAPARLNIANGAMTQFQPIETNRNIDVTYIIGQIQFTEQVTWNSGNCQLKR